MGRIVIAERNTVHSVSPERRVADPQLRFGVAEVSPHRHLHVSGIDWDFWCELARQIEYVEPPAKEVDDSHVGVADWLRTHTARIATEASLPPHPPPPRLPRLAS